MPRVITAWPDLVSKVEDLAIIGQHGFACLQIAAEQRWLILGRIDTRCRPRDLVAFDTEHADIIETVLVNALWCR